MKRRPNDPGFELGAKWRFCNRCDEEFWSLGSGNRRCKKCEAAVSGMREVDHPFEFAHAQRGMRVVRRRLGAT